MGVLWLLNGLKWGLNFQDGTFSTVSTGLLRFAVRWAAQAAVTFTIS
jgi:hypothetical protein